MNEQCEDWFSCPLDLFRNRASVEKFSSLLRLVRRCRLITTILIHQGRFAGKEQNNKAQLREPPIISLYADVKLLVNQSSSRGIDEPPAKIDEHAYHFLTILMIKSHGSSIFDLSSFNDALTNRTFIKYIMLNIFKYI